MKLRNRPARSKAIFPVRSFLQLEQLESRESPTDIANVIGNAALAASFGGFPAEGTEPSLPFAVDDLSQASQTSVLSDLPILEPEPVKTESAPAPQPEPQGITIAGPTIRFVQNFNAFVIAQTFPDGLEDPFAQQTTPSADGGGAVQPWTPASDTGSHSFSDPGGGSGSGGNSGDLSGGGGQALSDQSINPPIGNGSTPSTSTDGTSTSSDSTGGSTTGGNTTAGNTLGDQTGSTGELGGTTGGGTIGGTDPRANIQPKMDPKFGKHQVIFEPNMGQAEKSAQYLTRGCGYDMTINGSSATFNLAPADDAKEPAQLTMNFLNASKDVVVAGRDELHSYTNYYIGNVPSKWLEGVSNFGEVKLIGLYDNIDAVYHSNAQGQMEYDFVVHPGAQVSQIKIGFDGAQGMSINDQGALVIQTAAGPFVQPIPTTFQLDATGAQTDVTSTYSLDANGQLTFSVGTYDLSSDLIIDPTPPPITTLNTAVAVDGAGNSVAVGRYGSGSTVPWQVLITKTDPNNQNVFRTFFGGPAGQTYGYGVAVDAGGQIFLTGQTGASLFPVTSGAFQTTKSGTTDAYVMKISPTGHMLASTFLGGTGADSGNTIAIGSYNLLYVGGSTANFPVTTGAMSRAKPAAAFPRFRLSRAPVSAAATMPSSPRFRSEAAAYHGLLI